MKDFFFTYYYKHISDYLKANKDLKNTNEMFVVNRYISNVASNELTFWIMTKRKEKAVLVQKRLEVLWNYLSKEYNQDLKKKVIK